ncbi:MAG: DUF3108 domain-containing protein [Opitutaceae bacterium]
MGERLVFRLKWGIVSAGTTTIETHPPEATGEPVRVQVVTQSHGLVEALFPLKNDSTCFIDPQTGRPVKIEIRGHDNDSKMDSTTIFDYEAGEVRHTDEIRPERSGTAALPDEPVYDIMVTMLKLRESPLKVGEKRRVKIAFDDDIYDLELTATEEDRIETPVGRFEAVAVEPEQKGELQGFFAKGGKMKFWISKGESPQIVRMDFRVKIGTITGVLIEERSEQRLASSEKSAQARRS